jgi:hypothetical protein
MTEDIDDPKFRRAGDPSDHAAERDALRHELGMGAVRAPLPIDVDRLVHEHPAPPPGSSTGADGLMDLVSHQKPPIATHFVEGALDEHARHEREAQHEDSRPD